MLNLEKPIKTPIFALLTPFDDNLNIDFGAMKEYLSFLEESGVECVVTNGTTAEFPMLTTEERKKILEFTRMNFSGTIINNISDNSFMNCRYLLHHSYDIVQASLILPPFYYANLEDISYFAFMKEIVKDIEMPLFLYNFKLHTRVRISNEWIKELNLMTDKIIGIKDSDGDVDKALEYKQNKNFKVFVGSDRKAFETLQKGLDGTISGNSSPVPKFLIGMTNAFNKGDIKRAEEIQKRFNVWNMFLTNLEYNKLALVKAAMSVRIPGFKINTRAPLLPCEDQEYERIATFVSQFIM